MKTLPCRSRSMLSQAQGAHGEDGRTDVVVSRDERRAVRCDTDTSLRYIFLRQLCETRPKESHQRDSGDLVDKRGGTHEFVCARIGCQVPDLDSSSLVAGDDLALVRVYRDVCEAIRGRAGRSAQARYDRLNSEVTVDGGLVVVLCGAPSQGISFSNELGQRFRSSAPFAVGPLICKSARKASANGTLLKYVIEATRLVSHIRIVPSSLPVTSHLPSQCQATLVTFDA